MGWVGPRSLEVRSPGEGVLAVGVVGMGSTVYLTLRYIDLKKLGEGGSWRSVRTANGEKTGIIIFINYTIYYSCFVGVVFFIYD